MSNNHLTWEILNIVNLKIKTFVYFYFCPVHIPIQLFLCVRPRRMWIFEDFKTARRKDFQVTRPMTCFTSFKLKCNFLFMSQSYSKLIYSWHLLYLILHHQFDFCFSPLETLPKIYLSKTNDSLFFWLNNDFPTVSSHFWKTFWFISPGQSVFPKMDEWATWRPQSLNHRLQELSVHLHFASLFCRILTCIK